MVLNAVKIARKKLKAYLFIQIKIFMMANFLSSMIDFNEFVDFRTLSQTRYTTISIAKKKNSPSRKYIFKTFNFNCVLSKDQKIVAETFFRVNCIESQYLQCYKSFSFTSNQSNLNPTFSMKYISSNTLGKYLKNPDYIKKWGIREMMNCLFASAEGLNVLHQHLICHGNFNPSNIIIDEAKQSYLSDFGLYPIKNLYKNTDELLTYNEYKDPTLDSCLITPKNDIYSFGVLMCQFYLSISQQEEKLADFITKCDEKKYYNFPSFFGEIIPKCFENSNNRIITFKKIIEAFQNESYKIESFNVNICDLYSDFIKVDYIESLANINDSFALNKLGKMYCQGKSRPIDLSKSLHYFEQSALLCNSEGQNNYGVLLNKTSGKDDKESKNKALFYIKSSAEQGNIHGMGNYGIILLNGDGVAKNIQIAEKFLQKSGDLGYSIAQVNYGYSLIFNNPTSERIEKGLEYIKNAIYQNDSYAYYIYGLLLLDGKIIEKNERLAMNYLKISADLGYEESMLKYAKGNLKGIGVPVNIDAAKQYYQMASQKGNKKAAEKLNEIKEIENHSLKYHEDSRNGDSYQPWIIVEGSHNSNKKENVTQSNSQQDDDSNLNDTLENGISLYKSPGKENKEKGLKIIKNLADQGCAEAQIRYGVWADDQFEGHQYIKKAVDNDCKEALLYYARDYMRGRGVKQNLSKAIEIYLKLYETHKMSKILIDIIRCYKNIDYKLALCYMQKLADSNDDRHISQIHNAQFEYGLELIKGENINKNIPEAIKYLMKSNQINLIREEYPEVFALMPHDFSTVQSDVELFLNRNGCCDANEQKIIQSSYDGNVDDTLKAAKMLEKAGYFMAANFFYEIAADSNQPEAAFILGNYYLKGKNGLEIDNEKGNKYKERASKLGNNESNSTKMNDNEKVTKLSFSDSHLIQSKQKKSEVVNSNVNENEQTNNAHLENQIPGNVKRKDELAKREPIKNDQMQKEQLKSDQLNSDQIKQKQDKSGQGKDQQVKNFSMKDENEKMQMKSDSIKSVQASSEKDKSNQIKNDQDKSKQVESKQRKSEIKKDDEKEKTPIKSEALKNVQANNEQEKSTQKKPVQIKADQIKKDQIKPNQNESNKKPNENNKKLTKPIETANNDNSNVCKDQKNINSFDLSIEELIRYGDSLSKSHPEVAISYYKEAINKGEMSAYLKCAEACQVFEEKLNYYEAAIDNKIPGSIQAWREKIFQRIENEKDKNILNKIGQRFEKYKYFVDAAFVYYEANNEEKLQQCYNFVKENIKIDQNGRTDFHFVDSKQKENYIKLETKMIMKNNFKKKEKMRKELSEFKSKIIKLNSQLNRSDNSETKVNLTNENEDDSLIGEISVSVQWNQVIKGTINIKENGSKLDKSQSKYLLNKKRSTLQKANSYENGYSIDSLQQKVEFSKSEGQYFLHALIVDNQGRKKELVSQPLITKGAAEFTYDFVGHSETVTLEPGRYKLEVWGAEGGKREGNSKTPGKGGYSVGTLELTTRKKLYIHVGESPSTESGGWNGGGSGKTFISYLGAGGGGSTDISLLGEEDSENWNNKNHLYSRIIVAGGGGGSASDSYPEYYGGYGGGICGQSSGWGPQNNGGTQTKAGVNSKCSVGQGFGVGGSYTGLGSSGGGGGWYGGGASNNGGGQTGGAGGSGYVYNAKTASFYPHFGKLDKSFYLADSMTVEGDKEFPSPVRGINEKGHSGNGYAKITPQ